jgi:hypothetical protein
MRFVFIVIAWLPKTSILCIIDLRGTLSIVVQQLFNQINMSQHHSSTAVSLKTQLVQGISERREEKEEMRNDPYEKEIPSDLSVLPL